MSAIVHVTYDFKIPMFFGLEVGAFPKGDNNKWVTYGDQRIVTCPKCTAVLLKQSQAKKQPRESISALNSGTKETDND